MSSLTKKCLAAALCLLALTAAAQAQEIFQHKGIDSMVDYKSLAEIGLWDDRNYQLTREDVALLADNEVELGGAVPAFFRVEVRKAWPDIQKGVALYPRSMLNVFLMRHGGYLYDGKLYRKVERREDGYRLIEGGQGYPLDDFLAYGWEGLEKALVGEVRVTNPTGAAESAIKINHTNVNQVVAGTNGPGSGQKMHYSTDGGSTWTESAALPQGNTCCDPTVDWSLDGAYAYASALGHCGSVCDILFYRSSDGGQTWDDLSSDRRRLTTDGLNDKEFLHADKYPTSPYVDNLYLTYHKQNVMQFASSTDFGDTWSIQAFSSATDQRGIGSDIATDKSGNVYYVWPAFNSQRILVRKSTDGGASFGSVIEIAPTEASFDFPIPAMETRAAFIYVSVDVDLSTGPFANSIYAAWLDTDGPESGSAANNHSRIQVAYSRDGGSTWNLSTPHETADINTVDRFNPWLAVGPDGQVHVIFYDTRRVTNRTGTDLFYSSSADGAVTWTAPVRVTDEISPNIDDTFEFGDYNGADIVLNDVLAIYTDNRNEGGGGADSVDVYAAGIPVGTPCTPQAIADAGPDVQINEGSSTTIGTAAQPAHTYSWSPGGATTAQINVSPAVTTVYTVTATTSCGSNNDSVTVTVTPAGSNGPQDAVYDAGLGAPACAIAGSECDSLALLDGRDGQGPEPNQPNTLDVCNDGTAGTYHSDESNDQIVVSTLDGGNFTEGDTVQIDATVWAWSTGTSDTLDLYYAADANSPSWTFIASIVPPGGGAQTLSVQYTLPAGTLQAIRANFRYTGSASPCSTGTYDDHDDLVFAVEPDFVCTLDSQCDDGEFCNGAETCNTGTGQCESASDPCGDDGQFCNGAESCDEGADQCVSAGDPCGDDGQFCNGAESCDEGGNQCVSAGNPCGDDGQFCNGTESCDEGGDQCVSSGNPCGDDGQFCNGTESCDEGGNQCVSSGDPCPPGDICDEGTNTCEPPDLCTGVVCDDGNVCTDDACNPANGLCEFTNNTASCDDGAFCTVGDVCSGGSCTAGTGNPCGDDGQFCNGAESCDEGGDQCVSSGDPCLPGEVCDEGTDMCEMPGGDPVIYMSFRSNTSVPGVGTVADEDIVSYDEGSGTWALEFDGSDVGLGGLEISGMAILPSGNLLLSFTAAGTVGGLSIDDSDIVEFTPTSLGATTAGSFSWYFDGSDVNLTSNGEDVDGIALAADGRLIVSTTGGFSGSGASGADEDLFVFTGTVGSSNTSGSFSRHFDGSDVGQGGNSAEDTDAAAFTAGGNLLLSTSGSFSVPGLTGADEDVVEFAGTFGSATSGSHSMRQDLSALGIAGNEDIGSLHIVE